jgi:hypothetical protein
MPLVTTTKLSKINRPIACPRTAALEHHISPTAFGGLPTHRPGFPASQSFRLESLTYGVGRGRIRRPEKWAKKARIPWPELVLRSPAYHSCRTQFSAKTTLAENQVGNTESTTLALLGKGPLFKNPHQKITQGQCEINDLFA